MGWCVCVCVCVLRGGRVLWVLESLSEGILRPYLVARGLEKLLFSPLYESL